MKKDIEKILISKTNLKKEIKSLAQNLCKKYKNKELVILTLMDGAFLFTADLVRELDIPVQLEFIKAKSYEGTTSTGFLTISNFDFNILNNKHVLIVDDILDTGLTMSTLCSKIRNITEVLSLNTCVLLDKQLQTKKTIKADFTCFKVPNEFVVGYGLDYNGKYRNLPYIGILKEEIYNGMVYR